MVEVQFEPIEGQEYPDIRDRYDKNDPSGCFKELNKILVVKKIITMIKNNNAYCLLSF